MNRIMVIVVTYNGMKWVDKCFGSLRESLVPVDVLAVDNGSTDGTVDYLREHFPEVGIVETGANLGFGAANNIGLRGVLDTGYDYVYLLNEDAWVMPDTIGKLVDAFGKVPGYGILSPMQMDATMSEMDVRFAKHCAKPLDGALRQVVEVSFVMAAHWLISRECLSKVGGFSPAFPHYGEDEDYVNRAHFHGFKVGVVPAAKAVHDRAGRQESRKRRMRLKEIGCRVRLCDPGRPFGRQKVLQPLRMAGMALRRGSLYLLCRIPALCLSMKELKSYRGDSQLPGAFL